MAKKQAITKGVRDAISILVYKLTLEEIEDIKEGVDNLIMPLIERRDLCAGLVEILRVHLPKQNKLYKEANSLAQRLRKACDILDGLYVQLDDLHERWREFDNEFDE